MAYTSERINAFRAEINEQLAKISQIVGEPVELTRFNGAIARVSNNEPAENWLGLFSVERTLQDYQIRIVPDLLNSQRPPHTFTITSFRLSPFPGCCALAISHGMIVANPFRRKGINQIGNVIRQLISKASGYTTLVCTDIITNEAQRRTLSKNGWKDIHTTVNRRTNNTVIISCKDLWRAGEA